jgi:hypothetical protein
MVVNKHDTLLFEGYQRFYEEKLIKKNTTTKNETSPANASNATKNNTTPNPAMGFFNPFYP